MPAKQFKSKRRIQSKTIREKSSNLTNKIRKKFDFQLFTVLTICMGLFQNCASLGFKSDIKKKQLKSDLLKSQDSTQPPLSITAVIGKIEAESRKIQRSISGEFDTAAVSANSTGEFSVELFSKNQ